jgi:hypothetical protein
VPERGEHGDQHEHRQGAALGDVGPVPAGWHAATIALRQAPPMSRFELAGAAGHSAFVHRSYIAGGRQASRRMLAGRGPCQSAGSSRRWRSDRFLTGEEVGDDDQHGGAATRAGRTSLCRPADFSRRPPRRRRDDLALPSPPPIRAPPGAARDSGHGQRLTAVTHRER